MHIHIQNSSPGWELIMQSGVRLRGTVNIPLRQLLLEDLGVPPETLRRIDVLLLDGKPVDEPDKTRVPDDARLALAAGLPGVAGIAMKSGSAVRGLRPGITHRAGEDSDAPAPGEVELALYSLALPMLATHFLQRGVFVDAGRLLRYARLVDGGDCLCDGNAMSWEDLEPVLLAMPRDAEIRFSTSIQ